MFSAGYGTRAMDILAYGIHCDMKNYDNSRFCDQRLREQETILAFHVLALRWAGSREPQVLARGSSRDNGDGELQEDTFNLTQNSCRPQVPAHAPFNHNRQICLDNLHKISERDLSAFLKGRENVCVGSYILCSLGRV